MLFSEVDSISEAFDSGLERPEFDAVETELAFCLVAEVLFSVGTFDGGDAISGYASSHFVLNKFNSYYGDFSGPQIVNNFKVKCFCQAELSFTSDNL